MRRILSSLILFAKLVAVEEYLKEKGDEMCLKCSWDLLKSLQFGF